MRYVHIYSMRSEPERVRSAVPEHVAYWHELQIPGYLGGPFADRSGGLITFEADSLRDAERVVAADPFVRQGLLEDFSVREWLLE